MKGGADNFVPSARWAAYTKHDQSDISTPSKLGRRCVTAGRRQTMQTI
jgi:hypothetical protein